MFDALTDRLQGVFDRLGGKGVLSEKDVDEAMREVRVALLEADVALPVVRDFIAKAREQATGEAVIRSVRPADQVIKITYDGLVEMLGGDAEPPGLNLSLNPPTVILMAGLQEGDADLPHHLGDVLFGQHAAAGEPVEYRGQPICQRVEQSRLLWPKRSRPPCTIAWTGGLAVLVPDKTWGS